MNFILLGWSFHKTPIDVRDRMALNSSDVLKLGQHLQQRFGIRETVILNTCNRTELYLAKIEASIEDLVEALQHRWGIPELSKTHYILRDLDAVQHLFKVAASLDSMVVGEPQILGQMKEAFGLFDEEGLCGRFLRAVFTRAFSTAKRVRSETSIGDNAVSISYAAVELAKRIFEDLREQKVLVIGAGEMAELAIRHLQRNGITHLKITNRTFSHAARLAEQFQGSVIPFEQFHRELHEADIVITSTGAHKFILTSAQIQESLRKRQGQVMFFIDIAVPRDIDPEINQLHGVFCYDIDDLQSVVEHNLEEREKQSKLSETIIATEVDQLECWFKVQSVIPFLRSLRNDFFETGNAELHKSLSRMGSLTDKQRNEVKKLTHKLLNKLLHKPSTRLKNLSQRDDKHIYLETLVELFELKFHESEIENDSAHQPSLKLLKK